MKHLFLADNDPGRLVNKELTKELIKLHARGYDLDFCMRANDCITCVQNGEQFPCDHIVVRLVDQVYDFISNCYQYVHTVDTACGRKGIMVIDGIYGLRIRQQQVRQLAYD
jgi:hypothetical protein